EVPIDVENHPDCSALPGCVIPWHLPHARGPIAAGLIWRKNAQPGPDVVAMLVEPRRREIIPRHGGREGERMPDGRDSGGPGARADDRVQANLRGEGDALVHAVDRSAQNADRDQVGEPLGRQTTGKSLEQQRPEQLTVGGAVLVASESEV